MLELIIIILIVIIGFIITIISSYNDYFDKRKKGYKKITKKGFIFIVVASIAILLYIYQYIHNENKNQQKEILMQNQQTIRDSINQKRLDDSNKLIVNSFAEGLAKYSLKYDSATKTIEKLIKNSKTEIAEPFISLCKINPIELPETSDAFYKFNLNVCNSNAPSKNIKADVYVVTVNINDKMKYVKYFNLFQSNMQLDKGAKISQQILVPNIEELQLCYFLVNGSWDNVSGTNSYTIDNIFHYNFENNTSGGITSNHEIQIRKFLKSSKIIK